MNLRYNYALYTKKLLLMYHDTPRNINFVDQNISTISISCHINFRVGYVNVM